MGTTVHTEGSATSENSPFALDYIDNPAAGTYTYFLKANQIAGGTINFGETAAPIISVQELNGPGTSGSSGSSGTSGIGISGTSGTSGTSPSGLVASNYVVRGYKSGAQTIAQNTDAVVVFTDDFDPQNWLASNKIQPTIAGYYAVDAAVWWDAGSVTTNQNNIQIRKNGSTQISIQQTQILTGSGYGQTISSIVYLNGTTDYIELTAFTGNTTSQSINSSSSGTWIEASLIVGNAATSGTSGSPGSSGSSGTSGVSGSPGSSGSSGTSGVSGSPGSSGSSGTSGVSGGPGSSGSSGTSGVSGGPGSSGSSGTSGVSGGPGSSGTSGTSGTSPSYNQIQMIAFLSQ